MSSTVRAVLFREQTRRAALGLTEQHPADPGDGGETEGRAGGAAQ
ncbi:hypothetical protein [Streptomyces monticola]